MVIKAVSGWVCQKRMSHLAAIIHQGQLFKQGRAVRGAHDLHAHVECSPLGYPSSHTTRHRLFLGGEISGRDSNGARPQQRNGPMNARIARQYLRRLLARRRARL